MGQNLDAIDLKILKILQERGKITNIHLSQEIGLSPAPTLERVKKLEKAETPIIESYHAKVNESALGLGFSALIHVCLTRQVDNAINNFLKRVEEIDEIVECYQLTGSFDYQLRIMVRDIPAFEQLIASKLSTIEEIGQMQTMVVLSKIKDSKVLPLNYGGK
jgi:Lrp/AsnC family leucine-responsive transcriptional regulator